MHHNMLTPASASSAPHADAALAATITQATMPRPTALQRDLADELLAAHRLLALALGCMTPAGQARFARQSEIIGLGTDGATRHHERAAVLRRAGALA